MEVFNGVCHLRWRKGHGSVHWDQLLNKGRLLPAIGGRIVQAAAGETITHANWRFGGDKRRYRWIRVEVEDPDGHFAWINPMAVDAPPSTQGKSQGT